MDTDMHRAARLLVERCKFSIFPIYGARLDGTCACGTDCGSPMKHPHKSAPHGFQDATSDPSKVDHLWALAPHNIGVATGTPSDLLVVDIDAKGGGVNSWLNLEEKNGPAPETWTVHTGGGGRHLMYRFVDDIRNRAGFVPGVDIRGEGGYIVAPPSIHVSGLRYEWDDELKPSASMQFPAGAPEWLLRMLGAGSTSKDSLRLPDKITEGGRNDMLTRIAGVMRRVNMSKDAVDAALQIENQTRCVPPIDSKEVSRIAWSIDRYPAEMASKMTFGGEKA